MVHQHRLVNWLTEENSPVRDARSQRYMLGLNSADNSSVGFSNLITRGSRTTSTITSHNDNRSSSFSSSPPRVVGLTLNMIPTLDNNNTSQLINGRSTHVPSIPPIEGQTGVGSATGNSCNSSSIFSFDGGINTTTTTTTTTHMMNEVVVADEEPRSTTIQSQINSHTHGPANILEDDDPTSYHNSTHHNFPTRPLDILSLLSHEEHPWMNFIRRRNDISPPSASRATGEATSSSSQSISSRQNDNNNNYFNFCDTFLAPNIVPGRPTSSVPPPLPPSNPSPSDYRINSSPPAPTHRFSTVVQSEQYMEIDSTFPSSESPTRPGNNNISISTSEIMAETNRLMDEIQSSLQYLRNGGSVRREDVTILDFLVVLNPLIDSDDWPNELMADLESQMASVETGLTEQEILVCINEETYQFNTDETSTQNQTCTICQEDFVDGERIGRLDCMHIYHLDCIKPWLELRNACPICKQTALENDEDENESEDGN